MESEAVLSLPVEGRWLFVIIILSADDVGLFEATEFKLARRADVKRELAARLLQMLVDADLVRLYEVDAKRYGFIPKFRQRLQIKSTKHPLPPAALFADDPDALNKINQLAPKTTVGAPVGSSWTTDAQPSEAEAEAEVEAKVKVSETSSPRRRRKASDVPRCPYTDIVAVWHEVLPELPGVEVIKPGGQREKSIRALWEFVFTKPRRDGSTRATDVAEGLKWFRDYFTRARSNDWIMGRSQRGSGHESWEADIDYVCGEKGMKRIIEQTRDLA